MNGLLFCECVSCRQALFLHRQALTEQLKETEEPALVLHLTSVLLFQASTQCMLHAPGRCVPQLISTLTGRIPTVCPTLAALETTLSEVAKAACTDQYVVGGRTQRGHVSQVGLKTSNKIPSLCFH